MRLKRDEVCASGEQCFKIVLSLMDSKAEMPISVDYYPVSLNYDANSLKATLKNPSKLPFAVEYYDFTWFGSADESYDKITDDTSKDFTYTYSGETYKAYRLDCVNYENQAFGYTDKGSKLMQDGRLRFEGPVIKEKTSFVFGMRRSWLDVLSAPALRIANRFFPEEDIIDEIHMIQVLHSYDCFLQF